MTTHRRWSSTLSLFLLLCVSAHSVLAQSATQPTRSPSVSLTASSERVRSAALGEVNHTRLQVFSADGTSIYDSSWQLGNLIDWQLVDQQGTRLSDGTYLFLVSVRDFSSKLTQKYGTSVIEGGQVSLEQTPHLELTEPHRQALENNRQAETLSTVDRLGTIGSTVTETVSTPASTEAPPTSNISAGSTGTQNRIAKWLNTNDLGDSGITEDAGGNVGIGTLAPAAKLSILTAANVNAYHATDGTVTTAQFNGAGGGWIGTLSNHPFHLYSNNSAARLTVATDGNIGIGITTPGVKLDIVSAPNSYAFRTSDGTVSTGQFNGGGASWMGTFTNHPFNLFTNNGAAQMTLNINGNVGVGTQTPGSKLTVNGVMESTSGGVKFPDATTQTTAFTVPLALTSSSGSNTISATNTGTSGNAGNFQINNASNSFSALLATTNGTGRAGLFQINNASNTNNALEAFTNGTGNAGRFQIGNASSASPALEATTIGTGRAGFFQINNSSNTNNAIRGETNGSGNAINGTNTGTGRAGFFQILNTGNSSNALYAETNGSGSTVRGVNIGTGSAGLFQINNASNTNNALEAFTNGSGNAVHGFTNGTGRAGYFEINNATNSSTALFAATTGTGRAGYFLIQNATNSSNALRAETNGSGSAVFGFTNGTGRAGYFEIDNASNTSNALEATTNGTGLAGKFDGGVDVNNARLLVSTDAGGSATVAVGERYRDNALIAWGKVFETGTTNANERFNMTAVRDSAGVYTITLNSTPTNQSVPVAVAEVDAAPTTAAAARIVMIDQINTTTFKVYIVNGSFAAVDNDFTFMVTGR